ncbi:hypothetical protein DBR33_01280 [Stenotrophomonas sp. HMWF022]|nr:hypothetical protein DBR20_20700 [Stenotrophomonas sp. HMWF023]PTT57895.1 hypothetical protein DBR33_01280 [Stenotrophomonas sp. HMWF022]
MIANSDRISDVVTGRTGELFFLYGGRYKWSILRDASGEIRLWFYPGTQSLNDLSSWDDYEWAGFDEMVLYSAKELGTREAVDSFDELYRVVSEKRYGVDEALDDIINGSGWGERR